MKYDIHLLLACAVLAFAMSCNSPRFNYLNPTSVNLAICDIDSTATALRGFEPKENPDVAYPGMEQSAQETYDAARETWEGFIAKCYKKDYKGAYEIYCDQERRGDFLVFLKHSSLRYRFDKDVLAPLIYEYEEQEIADSLYIDALELEYMLESNMMKQSVGDTDYIPIELPNLIADLGCLLSKTGRVNDAFGLVDDYAYAISGITGDVAKTNWAITYLAATFYIKADRTDYALITLEQYKDYSKDHMEKFANQEEFEYYMNEADEHIQAIKDE